MGLYERLAGIAVRIDRRRSARALRAARTGNADKLGAMLDSDPQLAHARIRGNTILEWLTQPGFAPPRPQVVDRLIAAGAEPDRALNLAGCWNLPDACAQLLAAGADPTVRADSGITALESAAMHSSREAADVLVGEGLHRPSLWLAAAAGQLETVRGWTGPGLALRRDPGPYRPDWAAVGRPPGEPRTPDPAEVIAEAFVFAALTIAAGSLNICSKSAPASIPGRTGTPPPCTLRSSSGGPVWPGSCSAGALRPQSATTFSEPTRPAGRGPAMMAARRRPPSPN